MKTRSKVSLRDILRAGLLRPGEELTCEPRRGEVYTAKLESDGFISYEGKHFRSASGWAKHVAKNSRDGWRDVRARGRSLEEFRGQVKGVSDQSSNPAKEKERHSDLGVAPTPVRPDTVGLQQHSHDLDEILEEHNKKLRASIKEWLGKLTGNDFQKFCKTLLEALGYTDVVVSPSGPDGGVDGYGKQKGVIDTIVNFQAKRWANQVGRPEIDKFRGAIQGKCHRGIFITDSRFTEDAKQSAMTPGGVPIEMIDGEKIINLMIDKRIGVKEQQLAILRLDSI